MTVTCKKIGIGALGLFMISLFVFGFVGLIAIPKIVKSTIANTVHISSPRSALFDTWQNPGKNGVKIYQAFYVLNITNAIDVALNGSAPILEEIGPYTYWENKYRPKESLSWWANGSVQYTYRSIYTFEPSMSVYKGRQLSDNDIVVHANLAPFGLLDQLQRSFQLPPAAIAQMMKKYVTFAQQLHEGAFAKHSVAQILWGYNDPVLLQMHLPASVNLFTNDDPNTRFKPSEMYTGRGSGHAPGFSVAESFGMMTMWEGMRTLPYWGSPYANMLNGTDGTQFKPNVQNSDKLYVFVDSIYRSGLLEYQQDVDLHGVTLKRFVIAKSMLQSEHENPDNAAFSMHQSGFLPMPPAMGLPITITKAHFMDCNLSKVDVSIDGHNPPLVDPEAHNIMLDIEPMTGAVFSAQKRLQLNLFMEPIKFPVCDSDGNNCVWNQTVPGTEKLRKTYLPVVWVNEYGVATESVCSDFISLVYTPLRVGYYGGIVSFVLCSVLILAIGFYYRRNRLAPDRQGLIQGQEQQ